jgi:hypothetical protein
MQFLCSIGPETFRILDGLLIQAFVLFKAFDVRLGAEFGRRRKDSILAKSGIQILI